MQLRVLTVTPGHAAERHARSHRDTFHAGQLADPPGDFFDDAGPGLVRQTGCDYSGKVDREHLPQVVAGVGGLQRRQRRDEHAGAGEQHERARDLRRRKDPQPAVRAGRHPHAAARQPEPARAICRRQPWYVGEQDGRHQCQSCAKPEHAGIHRGFERANGKARGILAAEIHQRFRQ